MAEPPPLLSVRDLRLSFGGLEVLADVTVSVGRGEIMALVGPNGAGKTSLLNCVNGLYHPAAGRIVFDGEDIAGWPPHRVAGRGIARSFQLVELFRHMTVLDTLLLGRHVHMRTGIFRGGLYWGAGLREETAHRRAAEDVLDFLELAAYRRRPVASLPYGVQKLVGIGRALAMEPTLLLVDEAASGLTRQEKEDLARFMLRIKHELGVTLLWVEHDVQLVADLADRIAVLHYGRTIAEGTPVAVLADPVVADAYLGRARQG
jgi:branched-chain amino acid transport system ATP-binding protein